MTTFTFSSVPESAGPGRVERDFESQEAAIEHASDMLYAVLRRMAVARPCAVAVGRGALSEGGVEWCGAWVWTHESGWAWDPSQTPKTSH